jgi:hypothetical protein
LVHAAEFERAKTAMLSSMEKVLQRTGTTAKQHIVREYTRHFTQAEHTWLRVGVLTSSRPTYPTLSWTNSTKSQKFTLATARASFT